MKILIAPCVCGFSLNAETCRELYRQRPDFFRESTPLENLAFLDNWSSERAEEFLGSCFVENDVVFFLDERNPELRTFPWLIEQYGRIGPAALAGRYSKTLKVVEVPDDVAWHIWQAEDGSESVHEAHRVWQ